MERIAVFHISSIVNAYHLIDSTLVRLGKFQKLTTQKTYQIRCGLLIFDEWYLKSLYS